MPCTHTDNFGFWYYANKVKSHPPGRSLAVRRIAAEAEAQSARITAEAEAARMAAEVEAARIAAEADAARIAAEAEAARRSAGGRRTISLRFRQNARDTREESGRGKGRKLSHARLQSSDTCH